MGIPRSLIPYDVTNRYSPSLWDCHRAYALRNDIEYDHVSGAPEKRFTPVCISMMLMTTTASPTTAV